MLVSKNELIEAGEEKTNEEDFEKDQFKNNVDTQTRRYSEDEEKKKTIIIKKKMFEVIEAKIENYLQKAQDKIG